VRRLDRGSDSVPMGDDKGRNFGQLVTAERAEPTGSTDDDTWDFATSVPARPTVWGLPPGRPRRPMSSR